MAKPWGAVEASGAISNHGSSQSFFSGTIRLCKIRREGWGQEDGSSAARGCCSWGGDSLPGRVPGAGGGRGGSSLRKGRGCPAPDKARSSRAQPSPSDEGGEGKSWFNVHNASSVCLLVSLQWTVRVRVKIYIIINQVSIEAGGGHAARLRELESGATEAAAAIKICI